MSNQVIGIVYSIGPEQQVTETFKKREFILEIPDPNPKYTQYVKFEAPNKASEHIEENISEGDTVEVSYDLKGRAWTNAKGETNYFNTLSAWAVKKTGDNVTQKTEAAPAPEPEGSEDDDLPF